MTVTVELTKEETRVIYLALRYYEMKKRDSQYPTIQKRVETIDSLTDYDGKIYKAWKEAHKDPVGSLK